MRTSYCRKDGVLECISCTVVEVGFQKPRSTYPTENLRCQNVHRRCWIVFRALPIRSHAYKKSKWQNKANLTDAWDSKDL